MSYKYFIPMSISSHIDTNTLDRVSNFAVRPSIALVATTLIPLFYI